MIKAIPFSNTVAGTKKSLVKERLQNGTIISLPFRRGYIVVL